MDYTHIAPISIVFNRLAFVDVWWWLHTFMLCFTSSTVCTTVYTSHMFWYGRCFFFLQLIILLCSFTFDAIISINMVGSKHENYIFYCIMHAFFVCIHSMRAHRHTIKLLSKHTIEHYYDCRYSVFWSWSLSSSSVTVLVVVVVVAAIVSWYAFLSLTVSLPSSRSLLQLHGTELFFNFVLCFDCPFRPHTHTCKRYTLSFRRKISLTSIQSKKILISLNGLCCIGVVSVLSSCQSNSNCSPLGFHFDGFLGDFSLSARYQIQR